LGNFETQDASREAFARDGCVVVKGLLEPALAAFLWSYVHTKFAARLMKTDGRLTPFSYGDGAFDALLEHARPRVEAVTGLELAPTYSIVRLHKRGDALKIHHDRPASEVVATVNLGQVPQTPWPFTVEGRTGPVRGELMAGDAMIYLGHALKHWRADFEGQKLVQGILSYVDRNGPHAGQKFDGRESLMRPPVPIKGKTPE
jgi:hypothetical protein